MPENENEGKEFNWREHLSEEHSGQAGLKDFGDINALAKAFLDTKSMVGGMIRVPGQDAPAEDIAKFRTKLLEGDFGVIAEPDMDDADAVTAFRRKLGMPENVEGYSAIEGMPKDRFTALSKLAHTAGISDKQLTKLLSGMVAGDNEMLDTLNNARELDMTSLKKDWGDAYKEKTSRAVRLAEMTKAPKQLVEAMVNGSIDSETMIWIDSLADSIGAEGQNLKDDMGAVTSDTKDELTAKRDELNRKLINDKFSSAEKERLIQKLVGFNERIVNMK